MAWGIRRNKIVRRWARAGALILAVLFLGMVVVVAFGLRSGLTRATTARQATNGGPAVPTTEVDVLGNGLSPETARIAVPGRLVLRVVNDSTSPCTFQFRSWIQGVVVQPHDQATVEFITEPGSGVTNSMGCLNGAQGNIVSVAPGQQ